MSDSAAAAAAAAATSSSALRFMSSYQRCDFSAQEICIEILPRFEMGRISFICGEYGPFSPNYPVIVPIWLALFLRETNTCTIRPSKTMSARKLNEILQFENDHPTSFYPLPHFFYSMMRQLLRYAAADIPDAAVVHHLLDELEQRRIGKITQSIGALSNADTLPPPAFNAGHLTASELLVIKSTLGRVVNDGQELRARAEQRLYRPPGSAASAGAGAGAGGGGLLFGATPSTRGGSSIITGDTATSSGGRDTLFQAQRLLHGVNLSSDGMSTTAGGAAVVDTYFGGAPGQSMGFVTENSMDMLSQQTRGGPNLTQELLFQSQQSNTSTALPPPPKPAKKTLRG